MTAELRDAIHAAISPLCEALERIEKKQDDISAVLNGNGRPGVKGRLVRLETIVTVLAAVICILMPTLTAVGCFVAPRLLPIITEKK